jgi:hypothetical protein
VSGARSSGTLAHRARGNARAGRRVAALGRWGAEVVARHPNRTLTWLVGAPVERLTVVRHVGHWRAAA